MQRHSLGRESRGDVTCPAPRASSLPETRGQPPLWLHQKQDARDGFVWGKGHNDPELLDDRVSLEIQGECLPGNLHLGTVASVGESNIRGVHKLEQVQWRPLELEWELEDTIELCLCKGKAEGNRLVQAGGDGSGKLAVCSHLMGAQSKSFSGKHSGRM